MEQLVETKGGRFGWQACVEDIGQRKGWVNLELG